MDLNLLFIFCRVAQTGSFTSAARSLGIPKSTVSRKVQDLEERLGVALLTRTTRKLNLTDAGQQLYLGSREPLAALEGLQDLTAASGAEARGRVRVTSPIDIGNMLLPKILAEFLELNSKVTIDLSLNNRSVDLISERFDVALRVGQLRDSSLHARKVGTISRRLYASPAFIKRHGPFRSPEDVEPHLRFRFSSLEADEFFTVRSPQSVRRLKFSEGLAVDSHLIIRELAVEGLGVALLPSFLCVQDVENRKLLPILETWSSRTYPIHLVYTKQKHMNPATRVLIDFMLPRLRSIFTD